MFGLSIPPMYKYAIYALIISIILGSAFAYGYNKAENKYIAKIAKLEADAQGIKSRLDTALANVKIETVIKYVDRIQVIKEKEYVYRNIATNVVPPKCELNNGWVYLHDTSARGDDADSTRAADETTSGIKDNQGLGIITDNYSICHRNAEQLVALQDWIRESQSAVKEANEKKKKKANK